MVALKPSEADAFVARPDPARAVVLVFGPDAGLVSERVDAIVRASVENPADPFSFVRLDGDAIASDPARLVDEASTIPLFGGRRAIRVRAPSRGNLVPALEALLALPLKDCRVVIEAGDLRKTAPLRTLVERAKNGVAVPCYEDDDKKIERLIDEEMLAADLTIAPEARAALAPLLGGDRRASRAELRKLALYAGGAGRVELDDVMAVVADASALALDSLVDAAFAGQLADVEKELAKAKVAGTSAAAIIGATIRHAERLHSLALDIEGGASVSNLVERPQSGIHFSRKAAFTKALRAWTPERLAGAMTVLGQTSLDARKAKRPELAETIAHRALMLIARGAGRGG
ncbi:MAG TPA: DNA polymerase III subunit delta [Rhodanobacteraceae bacterium]|jgi:DNA polymerase-3 subunit delta